MAPTDAEFRRIATELKPIFDPRCAICAEVDGRAVACAVADPRRQPGAARAPTAGCFRSGSSGCSRRKRSSIRSGCCCSASCPSTGRRHLSAADRRAARGSCASRPRYKRVEFSWVLEDNRAINQPVERVGAVPLQDLPHLPEGASRDPSVAITGATGFIGRHVAADAGLARRTRSRAIVRPDSRHDGAARASAVVTRRSRRPPCATAFAGVDAVVHLAGVVAAVDAGCTSTVNVEGTRAVAEAAAPRRPPRSHLEPRGGRPGLGGRAARKTTRRPDTPYGRSKLDSERIVDGMPGCGGSSCGPASSTGRATARCCRCSRPRRAACCRWSAATGAAYTFVHVDDVVRTIVAAVEKTGVGGPMFVGHPRAGHGAGLARRDSAAVGRPGRRGPGAHGVDARARGRAATSPDACSASRCRSTRGATRRWRRKDSSAASIACATSSASSRSSICGKDWRRRRSGIGRPRIGSVVRTVWLSRQRPAEAGRYRHSSSQVAGVSVRDGSRLPPSPRSADRRRFSDGLVRPTLTLCGDADADARRARRCRAPCVICCGVCAAEQLARSRQSSRGQPGGTIRFT